MSKNSGAAAQNGSFIERFFKLRENKSTIGTEIVAGLTTFFTMAYIIAVNPGMLSATGMPFNGVFVATIIAAAVATLVMALFANVPYAQASGMGMNAFFTYTVVFALGFTWQQALTMVFICGIFNVVITMTKIRKALINSVPDSIQKAIGGGIGLFIAYMGFKNAGLLKFTADPGTYNNFDGVIVANGSIVPALTNLTDKATILALIGLALMIALIVLKVKGAIFISIIAATVIGIPMGITKFDGFFSVSAIGGVAETAGVIFTKEGFGSIFADPSKILLVLLTSFAFSLSDTFDTIGTFIGTGSVSGLFSKKELDEFTKTSKLTTRLDKALFADAVATPVGAILGTSNVTTYVESSAGIASGGRTGLTSLVVAVLFLLCLPFAPLFGAIPSAATAPAFIVVGILMMSSIRGINWSDFEEAVPAFFALVAMPFTYSISQGIAMGFITYCIIKILRGKIKEIHPILGIATALFLVNYIVSAVYKL
ncbi:MAG: NCS2 family permease [Oscillospiraceae bacterium]|nr:NCS2 family permease [Oscillospiraceae bacterium]